MKIAEIKEKISPIMSKYGIEKAAVFGSVARGEDKVDSDIDLLVKLGDKPMGMFKYMGFIEEIENELGRKVDIITEGGSDRFIKSYILSDLKTLYERR